jgi:hypothetical protein
MAVRKKAKKKHATTKKKRQTVSRTGKTKKKGPAHAKKKQPVAMTVRQVKNALQTMLTKNVPSPGTALPMSMLLSLYKPTPQSTILAALLQLQTAGYVTNQPDSTGLGSVWTATGKP